MEKLFKAIVKKSKTSNPVFHVFFWLFITIVFTLVFGHSWGSRVQAFYFISLLQTETIASCVPRMTRAPRWFMSTFQVLMRNLDLENSEISPCGRNDVSYNSSLYTKFKRELLSHTQISLFPNCDSTNVQSLYRDGTMW